MYLLANGYKAATGRILKVAINAGTGSWVSTYNPPHKFRKSKPAASRVDTYPEARGRFLHL